MAKFVLPACAALCFLMAAVFGWIGWSSRKSSDRLDRLPKLNVQAIENGLIGTEGYVEGFLDEGNAFRDFGLAFYFRSRLTGFSKGSSGERRPVWKSVDTWKPPLLLKTPEGLIRLIGDYAVTFRGSDPTWLSTEELQAGETERFEGLRLGQPVVALGEIGGVEARALKVDQLYSGTLDEAGKGARSSAHFGLITAGVLCLVGIVLITVFITVL